MHPPLFRPHPECGDVIDALVACHHENPFAKFVGACNDAKRALDKCLKIEKEHKRAANAVEAGKRRDRQQKAYDS